MADSKVGLFNAKGSIRGQNFFPVVRVNLSRYLLTSGKLLHLIGAQHLGILSRAHDHVGGSIPLIGEHLSGVSRQTKPLLAISQRIFCLPPFSDVLQKGKDQRGSSIAIFQKRDIQTSPHLTAIFSHVAFFQRVLIDDACTELLKESPIVLGIFGMSKLGTIHAAQFVLPVSQHGAKRRVGKQDRPLEILHCDSQRRLLKKIVEELFSLCCQCLRGHDDSKKSKRSKRTAWLPGVSWKPPRFSLSDYNNPLEGLLKNNRA